MNQSTRRGKGWRCVLTTQGELTKVVHVFPAGDLEGHYRGVCHCRPRIDRFEEGQRLGVRVTHNSFDGRELVEEHGVN